MVVLSNETAVGAENCILDGLAKSRVEAIRLAGTSPRFQKSLFAVGNHYETTGLPSTLRHLDCFKAPVDTRGLAKLLFPLPLDRPLIDIIKNSKSVHYPQLCTLSLDTCDLDDTDLLTISLALAKNRSLQALRVPDNSITNIGITYFCQNWSNELPRQELNLSENHIGATGAALLLQTVAQRPAMKFLMLRGNAHIGHAGLQLLGSQLPFIGLKHLDLSACVLTPSSDTKCSRESKDAARSLANGLRSNTLLESLYLADDNLGSLGAKLIMRAVAVHPKMHRLLLACDQSIGLKGLKHIGNKLPNTRLTTLQLDTVATPWPDPQTKLGREAGQALVHGVQNCPHLLIFAHNGLAPMWLAPNELFIDLNTTCRPMFSSESATSALWPFVLAHYGSHGKNNQLYFCLQEQPWLMVAPSEC